jgi:hypothetical protein
LGTQPTTLRDVVIDGADLDMYAEGLADLLVALDADPFVEAADSGFTTSPETIHSWLLHGAELARSRGHETPMMYVELNGFDINYDHWHVDAFPLAKLAVADGQVHEGSYEELPVDVPSLPLAGMERMQDAFRWWHEGVPSRPPRYASRDLADELVHARLLQSFRDAAQVDDPWAPGAQVAVTAHDRDPVLRFVDGHPLVERDHRPPPDQLHPRPLEMQVDTGAHYYLIARGGEYIVHPEATATRETSSMLRAIKGQLTGRQRGKVELPTGPLVLHLTQPVFEDVLATSAVGIEVVSDPLFEVLARAADPDVGIVSHPVDVVHPSDGTIRRYHLMHVTTIVEQVIVPAGETGLATVRRSAFPASSARRRRVFLPDRFSPALAVVSDVVLDRILERRCGTGLIAKEANLVSD